MKKVEITQFTHAEVDAPKETFGFLKVPIEHKLIRAEGEELIVSDGFHTFDELYEHRIILFIALCRKISEPLPDSYSEEGIEVWRSRFHSDGSSYEGWFILGINKELGQQISYHLPLSKWEETDFAETLDKAPEWDGHTANDVLERLKTL